MSNTSKPSPGSPPARPTTREAPLATVGGALRSVWGLLLIATSLLVLAPVAILGGLLRWHRAADAATRAWCRLVLFAAGARLHVAGRERIPSEGTFVLVSNHASHLDVPAIVLAWPRSVRFVAKRSLFAIPLFGQALRAAGHIPVVRSDPEQAREALARAVRPLKRWTSVLFFAEGTRSPDGRLLPFKKGCLAMAEAAGVPILPLAVCGTAEVLPKGSARFRPGPVAVVFGAPRPDLADPAVSRDARIESLRGAVARLHRDACALCRS
ncbi:MAG: 1-acyl-sn-glycerol-3-phosphate acyltransferase [Deltaproteobacteria bacterium]|nr:MAG: 1-acyl-sn-glycerol-3-phosphate acyltransferase [Deltaproteobacteria bacterium]